MDHVLTRLHHEIEVADDAATLYLSGVLSACDAFTLSRVCSELPSRVLTLRLDLHGVATVEDDAMQAVRGVLRYWRESRGGSFRLSFATDRIVATYGEGRFADVAFLRRSATSRMALLSPKRVVTIQAVAP